MGKFFLFSSLNLIRSTHVALVHNGLAKTITHASSYHIDKRNEVFAENFLHYFIAPNILKIKLPEVYEELDSKIPNKFKILLNQLLK